MSLFSEVEVYTWPPSLPEGRDFIKVEIQGTASPVIAGPAEDITTFSFSGRVEVAVTYNGTVTNVTVRPQR